MNGNGLCGRCLIFLIAEVAVVLQAVAFGLPHVYQGVRMAAMAAPYGILFGVLALWRRSLRPGILAHAWSDIAARLLRVWSALNGVQ